MDETPVWSSHPSNSISTADTQPTPRVAAPPPVVPPRTVAPPVVPPSRSVPRGPTVRRRPIGLYLFTGCLALIVLLCVSVSIVLATIGPTTLLALRDRWLGRDLGETVVTIGQMAQVIVANNDADIWPVPDHGRLTVLLLGVDSREKTVEGATRSDVITLVSIDPISHTAALLSIPRDLYVPLPGFNEQNRINTAYFWGEYRRLPGGGPGYTAETIAYNFGVGTQRYAVIDFDGFKEVIDAVGGVDVDVPREIVDYEYPTEDYGIETLRIPAGRVHMDGALALKYVRTRHADSDFGRLQRQQQVLLAVRDKALSLGNLNKIPETLNALGDSLRTDLTLPEILSLAKQWAAIPREAIYTYRIDETMVQSWVTPQGGQVLLPNRELIGQVVDQFLGRAAPSSTAQQP